MRILSPAIKIASAFAMGGAAFALANILLARHFSTEEYGLFTLVLTITILGTFVGPVSLDQLVLRHRPGPTNGILRNATISGALISMLIVAGAWSIYGIDASFLLIISLAIIAGTIARVGASVFQSERRYKASLWLIQSQNITLIIAAIAAGFFESISTSNVYWAYTAHWVLAAVIGWFLLRLWQIRHENTAVVLPWRERLSLFGYALSARLSSVLDRLIIPIFLDVEMLATFGVLAALVLAPFKMFEAGIAYTLIPGLRNSETRQARVGLITHEAKTTAGVILLSMIGGLLIAPVLVDLFLQGKYELPRDLILAAVLVGSLRLVAKFASSIITALGHESDLFRLNLASWIAVFISLGGGWVGSRWGLTGLVSGFSVGILVRLAVGSMIALQVFRSRSDAPTRATA